MSISIYNARKSIGLQILILGPAELQIALPFGQRPLVRQNGFFAALGKAQASLALRSLVLTEPSPSGVTERNRAKSPNKNNPNYRKPVPPILGTAMVKNGEALISTSIPSGDIAVVKVGGRSVKVIMR